MLGISFMSSNVQRKRKEDVAVNDCRTLTKAGRDSITNQQS